MTMTKISNFAELTASDLAALDLDLEVDVSATTNGSKKMYAASKALGLSKLMTFADTGGDDAYVISTGLSLSTLSTGFEFKLKPTTGNTGACTLAVDSVTATAIKVVDSSGTRDPLTGEIAAGMTAILHYNGTYFILLNPAEVILKPEYYVDGSISASNSAKRVYKTITEVLGSDRTIVIAPGTYSENLNINNYTNLRMVGLGKPYCTGSAITGGAVISYAATSKTVILQNSIRGFHFENIGIVNSSSGDGIGYVGFTGGTASDITIKDCPILMPVSSGHAILIEEAGATVTNITIEGNRTYRGLHGIIIKAKKAFVANNIVQDATVYSFAAISDNVVAATGRHSAAKDVTFIGCIAFRTSASSTSRGFIVYGVDYFSETNSNSVVAPEAITIGSGCRAYGVNSGDLQVGCAIARDSAFSWPKLATGQSQVAPVNVKIIGGTFELCAAQGLVVNYGTDVSVVLTTAKNNTGRGFDPGAGTIVRAIGCYATGNGSDSFAGWSTGNI